MEIKYRAHLNKLLPSNPIVAELGCAEGYFTTDMLNWPVAHMYMVDYWNHIPTQTGDGNFEQTWHDKNYASAMKRVEPFKDKVTVLRGITWLMANKVPDGTLDLLYLDACHSYDCVRNDLNAWVSKVKVGGVVAFHDYLMEQYGVRQAAEEFCKGKYELIVIPENKPDDAGAYFIKK